MAVDVQKKSPLTPLLVVLLGSVGLGALVAVAPVVALLCIALATLLFLSRLTEWSRLDPLSPVIGFGAAYVLYNSIGLVDVPGFVGVLGLTSVPRRGELLWYYVLGLLGFLIGVKLGKLLNRSKNSAFGQARRWDDTRLIVIAVLYMLIGSFAAFHTFMSSGWLIPLLMTNIEQARFALSPKSYLGNLISFLPAASLMLGTRVVISRPKKHWGKGVVIWVLWIVVIGIVLLFANRSALLWSIIPVLIGYHYLHRPFSARKLILGGTMLILLFRGFELFRGSSDLGVSGLLGFVREGGVFKILIYATPRSTAETFAVFLEAIPQRIGFFLGRLTLSDWLTILPGSQPDANALTMMITAAAGFYAPTARPPGLIGAYYAEFGVPGILGGMMVLGVVLKLLYDNMRRDTNPRSVLIYAWALTFALIGLYGLGLPLLSLMWLLGIVLLAVDYCSGHVTWRTYGLAVVVGVAVFVGGLTAVFR